MEPATYCFTCGQQVTEPPRLSELEDGEPCPTCCERALESVPAPLPLRPAVTDTEPLATTGEEEFGDYEPAEQTLHANGFDDDYPEPA